MAVLEMKRERTKAPAAEPPEAGDVLSRIGELMRAEPQSTARAREDFDRWEGQRELLAHRERAANQLGNDQQKRAKTKLAEQRRVHEEAKPAGASPAGRRDWLLACLALENQAREAHAGVAAKMAPYASARQRGEIGMNEADTYRDLDTRFQNLSRFLTTCGAAKAELFALAPGGLLGIRADLERTAQGLAALPDPGCCGPAVTGLRSRLARSLDDLNTALATLPWDRLSSYVVDVGGQT